MNRVNKYTNFVLIVLLLTVTLLNAHIIPIVTYKPPLLPFSISINTDGKITISGDLSIVTPLGTFSIGADYVPFAKDGFTTVVIRNQRENTEEAYQIKTGDESISVEVENGIVYARDRWILIDIKDNNTQTLMFSKGPILKQGKICINNMSNQFIIFKITFYEDCYGQRKEVPYSYWTFLPQKSGYLLYNDDNIIASLCRYKIETSFGETEYECNYIDDNGDLLINIENVNLPIADKNIIDDDGEQKANWTPGKQHSVEHPHVIAGEEENTYVPAPGYRWLNDDRNNLDVIWTPGKRHSVEIPHVVAGEEENTFKPAPGYRWLNDGSDLAVVWVRGIQHSSKNPYVLAGNDENTFIPAPGYRWLNDGSDLAIVWVPGIQHSSRYPHVLAGEKENTFIPGPGYTWLNPNNSNCLEVILINSKNIYKK